MICRPTYLALAALLLCAGVFCQSESVKPGSSTTAKPPTSDTSAPHTNTTTDSTPSANTTTDAPTNATTSAPTTGAPATTTTSNPITTNSSGIGTPANSASPSSPKSSTSLPTTAAPPKTPIFSVTKKGGNYCMLLQAWMTLKFNTTSNETITAVVPSTATPTGSCGTSADVMTLTWPAMLPNNSTANMSMSLTVNLDGSGFFQLSTIAVKVSGGDAQNFTISPKNGLFKTTKKDYYLCNAQNNVSDGSGLTVQFSDLKLLAFADQKDQSFLGLTANDCASNPTNTTVPIIVGCALAAMVLIVLIGYCIGRRRTRPGYQQMNE